MENTEAAFWRKCNSCKKPIAFGARYYVCSVSTCNGQRTGYVFCTVPCFEMHLPGARHKDAAAIESKAPLSGAAAQTSAGQEPKRTIIKTAGGAQASPPRAQLPRETLIIASRLKEYIQARAEMNTSGGVVDVLSDFVRIVCDRATENARADGRKTVLDRDFEFLKKSAY
jgi:histone H3/H4